MSDTLSWPDVGSLIPNRANLIAAVIASPLAPDVAPADQAAALVVRLVTPALTEVLAAQIVNFCETYALTDGDRPTEQGEPQQAYDENMDTAFEAFIGDHAAAFIGQGALGEHCLDCRLWEPNEAADKARVFARGIANETLRRDGAETFLARFGITPAHLATAKIAKPTKGSEPVPAATFGHLRGMVQHAQATGAWDALSMREDLDWLADSDDILAEGAAARSTYAHSGVTPKTLVAAARALEAERGAEWMEYLIEEAGKDYMAAPETANPPEAKAPRTRKKKEPAAPAAPAPVAPATAPAPYAQTTLGVADMREVIRTAKLHSGSSEGQIAEVLGVQRPALNVFAQGKSAMDFSPEQRGALKELLLGHKIALDGAIDALEGLDLG